MQNDKSSVNGFMVLAMIILVIAGVWWINSTQDSPQIQEQDPMQLPGDVTPVATVNDQPITQTHVDNLQTVLEQQTGQPLSDQAALDSLINQRLLLQEARELNITVTEDQVLIGMGITLAQQGKTVDEYRAEVEAAGGNFESIKQNFKQQLVLQMLSQRLMENQNVQVSEEEKRQFYDSNSQIAIDQGHEVDSYENIEAQIEQVLRDRKQTEILRAHLDELEEQADIVILDANYSA